MTAFPTGKFAARLAVGGTAMTLLVAAFGAVSLHRLSTIGLHAGRAAELGAALDAARWEVAGFVLLAAALAGGFAAWALRAVPRHAPAAAPETPAVTLPPVPRFPYVDRRGPNRAENVVRPAFGPPDSRSRPARNDWEAF